MSWSQARIRAPADDGVYPPPWVWEFPFRSDRLCLDFASTLGSRRSLKLERLHAPSDFKRWVRQAGLGELQRVSKSGLARAVRLREAIHGLATGEAQDQQAAIGSLNRAAVPSPLVAQLDASGHESKWLPAADVDQVLSTIARDAIDLLSSPLRTRIRECAGADCTILFLDTSRPGTRRWCAMEVCGNQAKSAGLRAKREADRATQTPRPAKQASA
ncbi:MAG: ABATE domain-containing protein [Solirubrobacterales bacterium]|nr:ABATE domain-containing protein [Solirubrobacterales bacterium]MBV9050539.1 ABATE domain-containing protein [Solirubrobacterales bacterium]